MRGRASQRKKGRLFFSEEKKQKTFIFQANESRKNTYQETKVFWFFFSKKNILSS